MEEIKPEDAQLIVSSAERKLAELPPRLPIKYKNGMVNLDSLEEAFRFAQCVFQAGMYPKGCDTPQKIIIAIQAGSEVGLKPIQALKTICVINNRPCLYADGIPAVVLAKPGLMTEFDERVEGKAFTDDWTGIVHVKRGNGIERTERFSWADAKRAKLDKKAGPWQDYPQKMLIYRARAFAFRALFPDALCGLHIAEEVQDYPVRRPDTTEQEHDPILDA